MTDDRRIVAAAHQDAINQAKVDAGLTKILNHYVGQELSGYLRSKMEREAREYLEECRARKLISFKEVDVRITGTGTVNVEYFK